MKTLIKNALIVNEWHTHKGSIAIENETITGISDSMTQPEASFDRTIDASGCVVIPGIIDTHVHFREPGLTDKADMESESRAAAAGGVTTFFDMPNTVPQTTTPGALSEKFALAAKKSHVNYSFFFGATNDNAALLSQTDPHEVPGVKLFMGSSTGNMLVDSADALEKLFCSSPLPIMAHCEDTSVINSNMAEAKAKYGDDPDITLHPAIRSEEACYRSTATAVALAKRFGARLHVAHITTARELELFSPDDKRITAEAVIGHLLFTDEDYATLGAKIKVNPAIKSRTDRGALRRALTDGRICTVATDHAPHRYDQKQGGCSRAASGMPMVQFSLPAMLELADDGVLTAERMVELMCHAPARLFSVRDRGFLRPGYKADIAIVRKGEPWVVSKKLIESKCGWSPLEGHTFRWKVEHTLCNGHEVYGRQGIDHSYIGQKVAFR